MHIALHEYIDVTVTGADVASETIAVIATTRAVNATAVTIRMDASSSSRASSG